MWEEAVRHVGLGGHLRARAMDLCLEKVMGKFLFVSPSGHVGPPYFHCPEGVPTPGEDGTHCAHRYHLRRQPDVVRPSTPGPSKSSD